MKTQIKENKSDSIKKLKESRDKFREGNEL